MFVDLFIVDSDGYVEGLNFVFGIALPKEAVALVFNKRLLSEDGNLYKLRLLKEVLHETGHLLGLPHCTDPSCVMSFSNSVLDVDRKKAEFCGRCKNKLKNMFNTF
jgi:archaemetzincin